MAMGWLRLTVVLVLMVVVAAAAGDCPRECHCEATTIRCTSVAGLRGLDKAQPIARLDLSGLNFTKVPSVLENVRNITELDLSGNRLAEVAHLGKRVRSLNLSYNRITSAKLARIPPSVESLNLTHNEITYLPLGMMKLKKLRYIELASNPINCTCETLHVRNWLTSRHVWSDEHIKCMAPQEFKGRPWLQVRQSDVCHASVAEERKGGYSWDDYEDENDLMLGDQPAANEAAEDDVDDFRREYFPVGEKVKRHEPPIAVENEAAEEDGDTVEQSGDAPVGELGVGEEERRAVFDEPTVEGSGGEPEDPTLVPKLVGEEREEKSHEEEEELDLDEGSGSGGGPLVGFGHISALEDGGSDRSTPSPILVDDSGEKEEAPLEFPHIREGLGIFRDEKDETGATETDGESTTSEASNARVMVGASGAGAIMTAVASDADLPTDAAKEGSGDDAAVTSQTEEDNRKTYILLSVLGIIVVSLIVMVVCKRKPDDRNRRGKYDVETANQGRELKELNRNLLEKLPAGAAERNGHGVPEQTPLMTPDKTDYDKVFGGSGDPKKGFTPVKPQRTSLERPLDSFKPVPAERNGPASGPVTDNNNTAALPNGNGALQNGEPLAGVHKPHHNNHVPSTDAPDDGHLTAEQLESPRSKRYSPIYVPTSPKSDRYSPVYSPETGRVKIKLTETPKPKTPILVTRSRSRAGDIIMTTNDDQKF
ncbi:protein windpipe [Anopheles cruzii]|uniref:protein windpipe n=1 Tax=Anopheles cruzii TaxID=68878 RepID=UPI0022EC21BE|nr:protein windpipe [Anopheles cruzii]XP_052861199.1 protein windpipe [Anopheles cruzii]